MTLTDERRAAFDAVCDVVERICGERYGDGDRVTDIGVGIAEPGYGDDETIWVLGNYNPRRWVQDGDDPLTEYENMGPAVAEAIDALELDDVQLHWSDEWYSCEDCSRIYRASGDSYSWKPYGVFLEDFGPTCADCLRNGGDVPEDYVNNDSMAVTWASATLLESWGWVKWEAGDEHDYENGWHPGQDDDPSKILGGIHDRYPEAEVIFSIDATGQFDIRFSAWTRGDPDPFTESLSSGHYSTDSQAVDAMSWLNENFPGWFESITDKFPEYGRATMGEHSSWFDTESMGVDPEWGSWLVDAIEATDVVCWQDGEPWGNPRGEDV